jgi:hypothetical protein
LSLISVELEEDELRMEVGNMASCEAVVDSGVDSEATTPSSPEDDLNDDERGGKNDKSSTNHSDMILETAETLLALSGKKLSVTSRMTTVKSSEDTKIKEYLNRVDTAVVFPQQPDQQPPEATAKGKLFAFLPMCAALHPIILSAAPTILCDF